ncbi:hypothetical protein PHYC_03286 [Phycisphaerales bacterium]|nr:hypothetical protein PHYC_03286 [Phycisphaerales bacterium]
MTRAPAMNEDQRLELASLAARTERANQPRHFVLLALVVLAGALVVLLVSWRSYSRASGDLARQRETAANVTEAAGRLRMLREVAEANDSGPKIAEGGQQIWTRIEQASVDAQLDKKTGAPLRTRPDVKVQGSNAVRKTWEYEVRDPNLMAIIHWMSLATEKVPGLEVNSVTIRPEAQQWFARVVFTRWERTEGS